MTGSINRNNISCAIKASMTLVDILCDLYQMVKGSPATKHFDALFNLIHANLDHIKHVKKTR